jgi:hypothetical protein
VVVASAAVLIIALGILPNSVVRWTERSKPSLEKRAATAALPAPAPAASSAP